MARLTEQLVERLVDQVVKLADENAKLKLAEANRTIEVLRQDKNYLQSQLTGATALIAEVEAENKSLKEDVESLKKLVA